MNDADLSSRHLPGHRMGESARPQRPPVAGGRVGASGPATVLLVDDEHGIVRLVERLLEREGYAVATAATGQDAVALAMALPLHAIVSDRNLPDTDGGELIDLIRSLVGRRVPAVLMSGDAAGPALTDRGIVFLQKPFSLADLVARVEESAARGS